MLALLLPVELIRQVVENIVDDTDDSTHRRDLCAVSLSCPLLRGEAQRVLFSDPGELHTAVRDNTIMFMDTIISSPKRLALYVKSFTIVFDDWFHPNSNETTALVQKFSHALQAMRNLESLDIAQPSSNVILLPHTLQDIHSQLTSFSWFGRANDAPGAANMKADFLRRQDNIKHLVIPQFIDESDLKPIAAEICPRIQSLSAPYSLTEILLPGKQHVISLQWTPPVGDHVERLREGIDGDLPADIELISSELGRIKYLSYDISCSVQPVGPNIRRIARYLKNLICLKTNIGTIKQVEVFSQLPRLQFLVLEMGVYDSAPPEEDDLIKVITSCKSLHHIDIEDEDNDFVRYTYNRLSKSLRTQAIERSDCYTWHGNFASFNEYNT